MKRLIGVLVAVGLLGCGAGSVVCPIIDLADQICPYVLLRTDAGVVAVPRGELVEVARSHARDGGVP